MRNSLLLECFVDHLAHEVGMKFSSIAITALLSAAVASPLLAQSSLVPHVSGHVSGHVPNVTGGSGGGLVFRQGPRRNGFNRNSGNGFGFGSGFAFGDAKGFGIGQSDRNDGHDRRWRGRHSRRHGERDDGMFGYGGGVGYDGYDGSYASTPPAPDQFGFFGNGGEATLVNGQAVYDYDRSYPYEYYRGPRREEAAADGANAGRAAHSGCETSWVPDGRGGGNVPVRICRR
jgi:hypothetical protein